MEEIISDVSDIFKRIKIRHVIIGGIAVLAWGKPRTTQDVDVITTSLQNELDPVLNEFSTAGFRIPKDARDRLQKGLPVKFRHGAHSVDLRMASFTIDDQALQRARKIKGYSIASKEDLIVYKLARFDYQDKADIKTVIDRQRNIDFDYVEHTAAQLALEARRPQILNNLVEMMTWVTTTNN
jgi:hypothetical protein